MPDQDGLLIAGGAHAHALLLSRVNRHGLIAGATGTGKTVTLRVMAESLSAAGVPVFMADVKGDLAGLARPGEPNPKFVDRARTLGLDGFGFAASPVVFWDLLGEQGHPLRASVSEIGPTLLARLLDLNETQAGILQIAFSYADDNGLLLDDLKDLRALLSDLAERAEEVRRDYGNISSASVGAIQRGLLALDAQGGDRFIGLPAFAVEDLLAKDGRGRGIVHVLAAERLMMRPKLYATFLLWLLSELFETLPEVGDLDRPKLVFFFDEAHLLFADAPAALVQKIEQVVRLIRSKGVGVYFVTQSPLDLPDTVLGQLGNRVQHALRAFTPRDQKAVRAAAETFRANPRLDAAAAIGELAVGEALVSFLDADGTPGIVERAKICPPRSHLGALTAEERRAVIAASPFLGRYDQAKDRVSAAEQIAGTGAPQAGGGGGGVMDTLGGMFGGGTAPPRRGTGRRQPEGIGTTIAKSVARNVAGQIGRELGGALFGRYGRSAGAAILRGVLGSILKGR